ncbi:CWF19-like protein 2 homolog isoform X2 [Macrosteles quadrilineatus]|nr:CWF19-like protein 2 homolog isoform X2 [Macrosteles quadrilineatus]
MDEWASNPALLACTSRDQLRQAREKKDTKEEYDKYMLDKLGRTDRELNPYWKDGGSGLPEECAASVESLRQAQVTVGDQGAAWLKKALQRAKEQAQDSGRPLAEVVAERWGSLEKLETMIAAAEERDKNKTSSSNYRPRYSSNDQYKDRKHKSQQDRAQIKSSKKNFSKPGDSSENSSDEQRNYGCKNSFERDNDRIKLSRYDSKHKESNKKRSKKVSESSESSKDSVEEDRYESKKYGYDRKTKHSLKEFNKPPNSSDEDSDGRRKDQDRNREKDFNQKFMKPHRDSSEEDNGERKKYRDRNREKDSNRKFARPRQDSSEEDSDGRRKYQDRNRAKNSNRKFAKPRHDSSEEDSDGRRKDRDRNIAKDYNWKFARPRQDSSEEDSGGRRKDRDRNGPKDSDRKFARPRRDGSEEDSDGRNKNRDRNKAKDSNRKFARPRHDSSEEDDFKSKYNHKSRDYKSMSSSGKGWRKQVESQKKYQEVDKKIGIERDKKCDEATKEINEDVTGDVEDNKHSLVTDAEPVLTDKELNELAAKLVKAELLGNQSLAEELKAKLSKAREAKANAPKDSGASKEVVILTHTDSKGFTRPVSLSEPSESSGGRRRGKKVETHTGGKRMRYFADDDKYSLQEMFQREKLNTVEDSNEVFAKLASKGIGRDDSARDMEDVFEETARVEEGEAQQKSRERNKAIEQSRRTAKTLENCQWCLDSRQMLKHLIVAIGSTCYLCVPPYQSLTDNHCLIVPRTHTPCATQLDEDVWTEIQDFRKALVQMFLTLDEDVVFFESARRLNQFPHMVLNCVPVPKETGDMAPIYFKKAIQECEQEWSNNKKLVDLKGRDVRRAVPKGLPYFAVDFGLDSGYAHVIEDEQLFPLNFAQEIIGGMLDLDHSKWRKQRRQTFEEQSKKVIQLSKLWSPFDITKKK